MARQRVGQIDRTDWRETYKQIEKQKDRVRKRQKNGQTDGGEGQIDKEGRQTKKTDCGIDRQKQTNRTIDRQNRQTG